MLDEQRFLCNTEGRYTTNNIIHHIHDIINHQQKVYVSLYSLGNVMQPCMIQMVTDTIKEIITIWIENELNPKYIHKSRVL